MTNVKGPIISFADRPSIEAYLSAHEGSQSGFWLKLAKAGAPEATVTKAQAVEAALCHGWIDGQLGKFDEHLLFSANDAAAKREPMVRN
jgi:uncharacterized protein YdeI (YjbR/CyaY-like superfamily)